VCLGKPYLTQTIVYVFGETLPYPDNSMCVWGNLTSPRQKYVCLGKPYLTQTIVYVFGETLPYPDNSMCVWGNFTLPRQ